jgi:hypothetical protein
MLHLTASNVWPLEAVSKPLDLNRNEILWNFINSTMTNL